MPHKVQGLGLAGFGQLASMWPTPPHRKQIVEMSFSNILFKREALAGAPLSPPPLEPGVLGLAAAMVIRRGRPSRVESPSTHACAASALSNVTYARPEF
eukprot:CAMPEP_0178748954 /NCGR_PEP_ID=MMETSP0744-20121128/9151_1 /TAXON_ID=913974 /ORGANISM="Nitzschia punctata, Strain CCMP561" /LENGTH=98 /DNA_ID=CAMNT_0020402333 /DNA_START=645 /DNA_END=941 /DNA_ORIENTATION=-